MSEAFPTAQLGDLAKITMGQSPESASVNDTEKGYSHAKSAIAQASVNQTDVKALPTILPNQEEQRRIFERAESLDVSLTLENQHVAKLRQQKHGLRHDP